MRGAFPPVGAHSVRPCFRNAAGNCAGGQCPPLRNPAPGGAGALTSLRGYRRAYRCHARFGRTPVPASLRLRQNAARIAGFPFCLRCGPTGTVRLSSRLSPQFKQFLFELALDAARRRRKLHISRFRLRRKLAHSAAPPLPARPASLGSGWVPGSWAGQSKTGLFNLSVQAVFV